MAKRKGPRITLTLVCFECEWEHGESYAVQSDSGHHVYCCHPDVGSNEPNGMRRVGDTCWDTPGWCPVRKERLEKFMREQLRK